MSDDTRRRELAAFLRTRRAAINPLDAGFPAGRRRRTPGLRREEVAQLSGVSVTWYTWLEQQRDISVSRQVVDALARALQLTPAERRHLFTLSGHPLPAETAAIARGLASPLLIDLITTLEPNPAYIMDRRWDLLGYNSAYEALVGGIAHLPAVERNGLWLLFTRQSMRTLLDNWAGEAQQLVGQFRAANAGRMEDPRVRELAESLRRASPDFAELWDQHQIRAFTPSVKIFHHAHLGRLTMNYVKLAAVDDPEQHLVSFMPADAATVEALPRLAGTLPVMDGGARPESAA